MANAVAVKSWFPRFKVAFTLTNGPAPLKWVPVALSQTIVVGSPVTMNIATGEISVGTAASGLIYGAALMAVTTTAADEKTMCAIALADRNTVFMAQADDQTDSIHEGSPCDIVASGSKWLVDVGTSSTDVCLIVGKVPGDDETDSTNPGRIYFIWKKSTFDALVAD